MDVRRLIVGVVALCALLASPACGADDTVAAATKERIGAIEQSLCSDDAKVQAGKQGDSQLPDETKQEALAVGLRFSGSTKTDTYTHEVWVGQQCLQAAFFGLPRESLRIHTIFVDAGASKKFPKGLVCGLEGNAPQMPLAEFVVALLAASKTTDGRHTTFTTINGEQVGLFTCSKPVE